MTGFRTLTITARAETRLNLRFDEDGEFYDFWPIYNVWQLQAIDGETPGYTGGEDLFGVLEPIRLGGRYRLMNDIDASVTEEWPGGFAPIGDYHSSFGGEFMGGGYVVRNLRIDRAERFSRRVIRALDGRSAGLGNDGTSRRRLRSGRLGRIYAAWIVVG